MVQRFLGGGGWRDSAMWLSNVVKTLKWNLIFGAQRPICITTSRNCDWVFQSTRRVGDGIAVGLIVEHHFCRLTRGHLALLNDPLGERMSDTVQIRVHDVSARAVGTGVDV